MKKYINISMEELAKTLTKKTPIFLSEPVLKRKRNKSKYQKVNNEKRIKLIEMVKFSYLGL